MILEFHVWNLVLPFAVNDGSDGKFDGSVYSNDAVRVDDISEAFIDDNLYVSDIVRNWVQP